MAVLQHNQPHAPETRPGETRRELDGLTAQFRTRADAERAVEHLTQEHGIDPAFIYVEPVADDNSVGLAASGGDCRAAGPSHGERPDAPLKGAIQLTVPVEHENLLIVTTALQETGAQVIEVF